MDKQKENVALSSVFASLFLTIMKLIVGLVTGSLGIISEAAHSGLDFCAALITYLAVRVSGKPADETHHFGHGKVESISALAETLLLVITSVWIIYEAIQRLFYKSVEIKVAWYSFAVILISIIVDISRSKALSEVARKTRSQALEADALHFSSDIYSSLAVLGGLFSVLVGIKGGDALAAVVVALLVVFVSYKLGRRTIDVLLDTAPSGLTNKLKEIVESCEGIVEIERIRVRPTGHSFYIDMIVGVSRKISLEQMNRIINNARNKIQTQFPDSDVIIHAKPVAIPDETIVERIQIIARNHNLSVHDISVQTISGKKQISFDLEVNEVLTLNKAHLEATHLEKTLKGELGSDIEVNTHIEPLKPITVKAKNVDREEENSIRSVVDEVIKDIKLIRDVHEIKSRYISKKLFITLHCIIDGKLDLEKAHKLSARVEYLIRERLPNTERVVVHLEPR